MVMFFCVYIYNIPPCKVCLKKGTFDANFQPFWSRVAGNTVQEYVSACPIMEMAYMDMFQPDLHNMRECGNVLAFYSQAGLRIPQAVFIKIYALFTKIENNAKMF